MGGDRIGILKAKSIGEAHGYIRGVEERTETDVTNNRQKNVQKNTSKQFPLHCYYAQLQEARQEDGEYPFQTFHY